ncbi:MAG: 30S ribosomal protein S1 [Kiritimatiellaeota bacterium]|nr:30S ribosomal protein S1 [Kiritimatiellota bacterium]
MPSMEDLLGESEAPTFAEGTVVQGRIVEKRESGVLVDIGYKAEGFVPRDEFSNWDDLAAGQTIDVYLELIEDDDHMPLISARRAELQKAWDHLVSNYQEGSTIKGVPKRRVKGGLIVDVGVDAFLPGSQVDIGPVRNLEEYLGVETEFKIVKINAARRNIVVSRRELLEEQRALQRRKLLEELKPGELRRGVVKNITDFGAFVDLTGMDGLLHITDMSWGRISHPSEVVKVGEEIEVMVLDVDRERERISLGLKQKQGDPWTTVDVKYPIGSRISGRVVNVLPYGAFVELEEGVEGLVHVSEMSWTKRVNKASEVLRVGDEVEAVVLDIQKEARKISLGLRQTMENPWETLAEKFPKGSKIKGKVRNMTSYGAFVQIQDDLDGMIHVSDMSWTRKINHPSEVLQKGQEVEAVILDIDPEQQRISLGLKQLEEDPWSNIEKYYRVGSMVEGRVSKIASFGAFVELEHGIDGLIHISQLSAERVEKVRDVLNVGDVVKARVIKISPEERRIGLSLTASEEEIGGGEPGPAPSAAGVLAPGADMVDVGDIFDSALAQATPAAEADGDAAPGPAAAEKEDSDGAPAQETAVIDDDGRSETAGPPESAPAEEKPNAEVTAASDDTGNEAPEEAEPDAKTATAEENEAPSPSPGETAESEPEDAGDVEKPASPAE